MFMDLYREEKREEGDRGGQEDKMGAFELPSVLFISLWRFFTSVIVFFSSNWFFLNFRLAWRIPGTGEPGGLPSMGSHRVGHD